MVCQTVFGIISSEFGLTDINIPAESSAASLSQISIISGILILIVAVLLVYMHFHLKSKVVAYGPTWGCGYTAGSPKQQYTSTSFAYNFNHLAKPVLHTEKMMKEVREDEIFPSVRTF